MQDISSVLLTEPLQTKLLQRLFSDFFFYLQAIEENDEMVDRV